MCAYRQASVQASGIGIGIGIGMGMGMGMGMGILLHRAMNVGLILWLGMAHVWKSRGKVLKRG
jgi:hypothetical protein